MTESPGIHPIFLYFDDVAGQIRMFYSLASANADVESVHDMRVAIKRMRALMQTIEHLSPSLSSRKLFKPLKTLFKSAGPLRDVHVQQALVHQWMQKAHRPFHGYYNELKAQELDLRTAFQKQARAFSPECLDFIRSQCTTEISQLSDAWLVYKINQRFVNLMEDIVFQHHVPDLAENHYHKIRKTSKEARYTLEVLQQLRQDDAYEVLNQQLRALHQALGQWHDFDVAQQFVNQIEPNQAEAAPYCQYLIRKKKAFLNQFLKLWHAFLKENPQFDRTFSNS